ncbi:MAG: nuclear transport factor 2 family protein [Verrucomicrobiota bacterium]
MMPNQSDHQNVVSTIHEFCRAFDVRDWTALRRCLAANLATDYSSFRGTPPTRMTADEFVALRQSSLAELVTQHLSFNHLVTFNGEQAQCRFDFVIHRWPQDKADVRFFHTFGYYEVVLHRAPAAGHGWVIESITQHALRNEGNPELHGAHRFPKSGNI